MARSATAKKVGRDKKYRDWVRDFPCVACFKDWFVGTNQPGYWLDLFISSWGESDMGVVIGQASRTETAHVCNIAKSQKCDDKFTAPLCREKHHQGSKEAQQVDGDFWENQGIVKMALINRLNARYEMNKEATA